MKTGAPGTPIEHDVEIGWRFDRDFWGKGYASEAARAALAHGLTDPAVPRIGSITVPSNRASWAVMERIGMTRAHDLDFDHPAVPLGHPLRRHVTYFIDRR